MKPVLLLTLALFALPTNAETKDDRSSALFNSTTVRTLHLQLTPDQWKAIEPTHRRNAGGFMPHMEYPIVHATVEFEGQTYNDVAMRYKGNSSFMMARKSLKKSIKLDFNKFVKKRTFFGQTNLNLNNNAGDSTASRETLAYELFAAAEVPAPRTTLMRVELTVPGLYDHKFIGLYTLVEEVNKRFLKTRFEESKGLLLKPDMARNLPYQGENWDAYKKLYVPKTEGTAATQKRFIEFLKLVHQSSNAEFEKQIESMLDVDEFLRFLAINAMTSNLDSILSMGHNFYIYVPEKLSPIKFIPWDLNEAFGGFGMGMTPTTQLQLSLVHAYAGENKIIERILAIPRFKQQYFKIVRELAAGAFSVPAMNARIDALAQLTADLMAQEKKDGLTVGQPGGPGGPGGGPRGGQGFGPGGGRPGDQGDFGPGPGRPGDNGPRGGQGDFVPGPGSPPGDGPRPDDVGPRDDGPRTGNGFARGQMRNGPGGMPGGPGGRPAKPELKPFVAARNQSIADQLAGKTTGQIPPNNRMPGGGPRGGAFGGNPQPR
jgi:spore coat protein CotH